MKRMGVLGGISAQATMDFEVRVHRWAQRLVPQHWGTGYPPMTVWYHREPPIRLAGDGRPVVPLELNPGLLDGAAWLGRVSDFLVIPCNTAHLWVREIAEAAGCPVLSMIDVTLDDVRRRSWTRVGALGYNGPPAFYIDPLRTRGVACEVVDAGLQEEVNAGIVAVMEGREGARERRAARDAVATLRARSVDGVILGCTEIPLLLDEAAESPDLVNPAALVAEAAVRHAMAGAKADG